eukprot:CFRG4237T1
MEIRTMGLLLTKFAAIFWGGAEVKIVVVGLDNAGKTTILYRLVSSETVTTTPTIGSNVEELTYKNLTFIMWDLGGQDSLRKTWETYYTDTKVIILVIDSTDRERLGLSKEELYRMLNHSELKGSSLLVLANKQDLNGALTPAEISQYLNLSSIKDHGWKIQPCVGTTGEGLWTGLDYVVDEIRNKNGE